MFLGAVWDDHWNHEERFFETGFAILGFGSLGVACIVNAFTGDRHHWRWIGWVSATVIGGVFIWCTWTRRSIDGDLIVTLTSLPAVIAHANLALMVPLRGGQVWWRRLAVAAAVATAIALDVEIWINDTVGQITFVGRIAIAGAIVTSAASLALLILYRLNRPERPATATVAPGAMNKITLFCPKCGQRQTIGLIAPARCGCGLQIQVHVDDATLQ